MEYWGLIHAELMDYRGGLRSVGSKVLPGQLFSTIKDVGEGSALGLIDGKIITVISL